MSQSKSGIEMSNLSSNAKKRKTAGGLDKSASQLSRNSMQDPLTSYNVKASQSKKVELLQL